MFFQRIIKNTNSSAISSYFYYQNKRNYSLIYCNIKWMNKILTTSSHRSIEIKFPKLEKSINTRLLLLSSSSTLYSTSTSEFGSELSNEFDAFEDFDEQEMSIDGRSFCLKNILYPNSNDSIILELNNCKNSDEILKVFSSKKDDFQAHHFVQSVILLWNFKRKLNSMKIPNIENKISSEIFENFLKLLNQFIDKMNIDELTCCFLYLDKYGVDIGHNTMKQLLQEISDNISDSNNDIPLTALSRFTVAVSTCQDLYTFFVCKDVIPHILKWIDKCKTSEEMRLITICMFHLHQMIDYEIIEKYKMKIENLLNEGIINNQSIKCLIKIINFLNFPHWSNDCTKIVRKLGLILADQNNEENLTPREIDVMLKLFLSHLEPASFIPKLSNLSENLLKKYHEQQQQLIPELLACAAYFSKSTKRNQLIEIAKEIIKNSKLYSQSNIISTLFLILRSLKISDLNVCNTYWTNTLNQILLNPDERINFKLIRHCYRYMHFNNNLGGTYRHKNFEYEINEILLNELINGISSIIPTKFAKLSSFILAYGYKSNSNTIPNIIIDKIEDMSLQLNIIDCLQLSRALQIAFEMRYRHFVPPELAQQFLRIENVLNSCAERHLKNDLNLVNLNYVIRSLTNRKAPRKTHLYKMAIEKYKTVQLSGLNSRLIREISFNLNNSGYLIPEVLEKILQYLVNNKEYITGDTVEKIITCCYNLGYIPENEEALYWSAEIIKRDFEYMTGLSIIQACLALCFYKTLPENLINQIFNIEFIRRLEDEIQMCYSKATYPERVLNQVMQLNRAVCLDFPESQVPWFQQNYIEAQMSKKPVIQTRFHTEIRKLLTSFVQDDKFIRCNHVTPYGYTIDFVIHFDKNQKPILPSQGSQESNVLDRITKVAILLLKLDSFCQNDNRSMRGHEHLRMRHLEMLGYKVIHINLNDWNSMYMNVPGAKMNYLKSLLEIE